jgi:hypothetical protein
VQSQRQQWLLQQLTAAAGRMKPSLSCWDDLQQGSKAVTDSTTAAISVCCISSDNIVCNELELTKQ